MISDTQRSEQSDFALLLQIDMEMDGFASDWAYCDRLSSYVARMVSHNRTDSILFSNLFSSALNELLETVFRLHKPEGNFVCSVSRQGLRDRIELTIPSNQEINEFYRGAVRSLQDSNLAERYREALFAQGPLSPEIGLLELAVDYNARLSVDVVEEELLRLIVELALEETIN